MRRKLLFLGVPALLAALTAAPLPAQAPTQPDPLDAAVRKGHGFVRHQLTIATTRMSEEDYAYRPTAEVRTFGQILAHIADNNYGFCAQASGRASPVRDVEQRLRTKTEIDRALQESFDYCDRVYDTMTGARARATVQFGRSELPAMAVLMFKSFHNSLHYGNVITYMRLRGKVPPPSAI